MPVGKTIFVRAAEGIKKVRAARDAFRDGSTKNRPVEYVPPESPAIPMWVYAGAGALAIAFVAYLLAKK